VRCNELISHLVPSLSLTDSGTKALQLMDEYHLSELPLLVDKRCIGLVTETAVMDWEDASHTFAQVDETFVQASIADSAHVYEAIKLCIQFELSVLPVHDAQHEFIGCITTEKLLSYSANGLQAGEQGGTIVLELKQQNYSLSEIARICESEQVSILSCLVHNVPESDLLHITIKTNKLNLSSVIATFERMSYGIVDVHAVSDSDDLLEDNYNALMHYMNI
jgi:acetoin utilization protein AcuB